MEMSLRLLDCEFKNPHYRPVLLEDSKELLASFLKRIAVTETSTRKFIVLKNDKKVYLVVGPDFVDKADHATYYFHRDVRQVALHILDKDNKDRYQIAGGGTLGIKYKDFMGGWFAEFGGSSSDYGTYDPSVLLHTRAIADWLGLKTLFSWSGRAEPTKKK